RSEYRRKPLGASPFESDQTAADALSVRFELERIDPRGEPAAALVPAIPDELLRRRLLGRGGCGGDEGPHAAARGVVDREAPRLGSGRGRRGDCTSRTREPDRRPDGEGLRRDRADEP